MSRTSSRPTIVEAAERLFVERGRAASLDEIAVAAGVSKGGLLYHFHSKDDLRAAVCEEIVDRLWRAVHNLVDSEDARDGVLLRAYVRALTGDSAEAARVFLPTTLPQLFNEAPRAVAVLRNDAVRWRDAFAADGLDPARSLVVRHSAEGAAAAAGEGYIDATELQLIRRELLAMAEPLN